MHQHCRSPLSFLPLAHCGLGRQSKSGIRTMFLLIPRRRHQQLYSPGVSHPAGWRKIEWLLSFFISHGEFEMNLRPDLVAWRCPEAGLTPNGKRQARVLAVFLNSQGIRFYAVYSSPLDRA